MIHFYFHIVVFIIIDVFVDNDCKYRRLFLLTHKVERISDADNLNISSIFKLSQLTLEYFYGISCHKTLI